MANDLENIQEVLLTNFNKHSSLNWSIGELSIKSGIDEKSITTYFAGISEIQEALYLRFMEKLMIEYSLDRIAVGGPQSFIDIIYQVMKIRYDYRFISRDFEVLMNENIRS